MQAISWAQEQQSVTQLQALIGQLSADGVTLTPGEIYVVVLSPFNLQNPDDLNYQIDITSPGVSTTTVPVELQRFTVE